MARRKLIAGNWKMNGLLADLVEIERIAATARANPGVDVAVCPPATLIAPAVHRVSGLAIGGQDCHGEESGAHTGCISAAMLAETGASCVIVGHSERRADQCETDADVRAKAETAQRHGLAAIVCVGETEPQRDAGQAEQVVMDQLDGSVPSGSAAHALVVAYEPVWAIGTGRIPTIDDVAAMHRAIRTRLRELLGEPGGEVRILYGGSMNAANAADLLAVEDVDGGLVGGASLTAEKFAPIIEAAAALA